MQWLWKECSKTPAKFHNHPISELRKIRKKADRPWIRPFAGTSIPKSNKPKHTGTGKAYPSPNVYAPQRNSASTPMV